MLLLDKPLVSGFVMDSVRNGLFPAFETGPVVPDGGPELLSEERAIARITGMPGERIHTISENAISWIQAQPGIEELKARIGLFKDKSAFRDLLADLYPGFFYRKVRADQLKDMDISGVPFPLIIKPNVGFFSMGVHKLMHQDEWEPACRKILAGLDQIQGIYPGNVLDTTEFILEEIIRGEEYAVDAYFDSEGEPVLVGVMHHLFGSENDVSDRVYLTSPAIIRRHRDIFMDFLQKIGKKAGLKNFSLHAEVRIDEQGKLAPIEINPLRFGAWCTSADLMHYAYDINPYQLYLSDIKPDWDDLTRNRNEDAYGIIILENSTGIPGTSIQSFDYGAAVANFSDVLELRKINYREYPIFAILFVRIRPENEHEIASILGDDLTSYISAKP